MRRWVVLPGEERLRHGLRWVERSRDDERSDVAGGGPQRERSDRDASSLGNGEEEITGVAAASLSDLGERVAGVPDPAHECLVEVRVARARAREERSPAEVAWFETLADGERVVERQKDSQRIAAEERLGLDREVGIAIGRVDEPEIELGAAQLAALLVGWQVEDLDIEVGSVGVAGSQEGLQLLRTEVWRAADAQSGGPRPLRHPG
jgi:hypothetical protein